MGWPGRFLSLNLTYVYRYKSDIYHLKKKEEGIKALWMGLAFERRTARQASRQAGRKKWRRGIGDAHLSISRFDIMLLPSLFLSLSLPLSFLLTIQTCDEKWKQKAKEESCEWNGPGLASRHIFCLI
jgi:hypothetical protein